ncbi:Zinc metalloprotease [uncultured Candidatus Thioglobus sp.]|nr:Zinc metalloprotease [uncultured Candidatus Thioglobus sp.]
MDYQIIYSNRKTLSLQINRSAELLVRAPHKLSSKEIALFVSEKADWIDKKINFVTDNTPTKPNYLLGEQFLYLGLEYPLTLGVETGNQLNFDGKAFELSGEGVVAFHCWYKTAFKKIAIPRLKYYAELYQFSYKNIRLKSQKTLWGSCSHSNNINLNYLLIGAPISVIDYVIVHELSHITHKNHSKDFWQLVESILPDYKTAKQWLKTHGHRLHNL